MNTYEKTPGGGAVMVNHEFKLRTITPDEFQKLR
jgi:hypothetical protein